MKYLKLFEWNSKVLPDKSDYYYPININTEEYDELKFVSISKQSIEYLSNITPNHTYKIQDYFAPGIPGEIEYLRFFKFKNITQYSIRKPDTISHFFVKELEDEYFYVSISNGRSYKCDQLDGIRELLEDLNII